MSGRPVQQQFGRLAAQCGQRLPLQVCRSAAGHCIGTLSAEGEPFTRESREYWSQRARAERALTAGRFTQKTNL